VRTLDCYWETVAPAEPSTRHLKLTVESQNRCVALITPRPTTMTMVMVPMAYLMTMMVAAVIVARVVVVMVVLVVALDTSLVLSGIVAVVVVVLAIGRGPGLVRANVGPIQYIGSC
jgi:hypothetical protein